jgi:hypothetical protein
MNNIFGLLSLIMGGIIFLMGIVFVTGSIVNPIDLWTINDLMFVQISVILIAGGFFFIIVGVCCIK